MKVPKAHRKHLQFMAAVEERAALRESSGMKCEWMDRWDARHVPDDMEKELAHFEEANRHRAKCRTCKAIEKYVNDRLGPAPDFPMSGSMRAFALIDSIFELLPRWARPAMSGAMILGCIVLIRMVFMIPAILMNPGEHLPEALIALGAAAAAGAVGGLAYSLVRAPFRRLGRVGDYATGVVVVFAYMMSLALVAPYAFGETMIEERSDLVIFAIVSAFFGLVVGHSWFKSNTDF